MECKAKYLERILIMFEALKKFFGKTESVVPPTEYLLWHQITVPLGANIIGSIIGMDGRKTNGKPPNLPSLSFGNYQITHIEEVPRPIYNHFLVYGVPYLANASDQ